eukprot:TRINITY_DN9512_c0_g2_i1.p1 TRINITY_DN9512_c0_g2~~TRINITY_DN9512_c0_g2_i1.p1  ORF type:complete len:588 (-),score=112.33 TRINITY_DN9512_c0_g2_i1:23-1735(-)
MVKASMVNESQFDSVCFSNSPKILEEIKAGSCRLRAAALAGEIALRKELGVFFEQLDSKRFSAASIDKATNTGGVSGAAPASGAKSQDREVVASIMQDMVKSLPAHWESQKRKQQQRQLTLAVNRQDAAAVGQILAQGADVTEPGPGGQTLLHRAAKLCALEVSKILLMHKADVSVQDERGNLPVHVLALFTKPEAVELFQVLAPTAEQLGMANRAGMKPARRFEAWASVCNDGEPYQPAHEKASELRTLYPAAFAKREAPAPSESFQIEDKARRSVSTVSEQGIELDIDTWESGQFEKNELLNVIVTPTLAPWPFVEDNLDRILRNLCNRLPLKVFVLNEFSVPFGAGSMADGLEPVHRIIKALTPHNKFVLVECSHGQMVPLLWTLRDQLLGAVLTTGVCGFFQEEMRNSDSMEMILGYARRCEARCANKDLLYIDELLGQLVYGGFRNQGPRLRNTIRKSQHQLSPQSWDGLCWLWKWFANRVLQKHMDSLLPLTCFPVLCILGDNASPLAVLEPTEYCQLSRFPAAHTRYIEDSKVWWFLESESQMRSACDTLANFLQTVTEQASS